LVVQKSGVANKERDEARMELEALQSTLHMGQYFLRSEDNLSWLGWIHRFNNKGHIVSIAMWALRENATTLVKEGNAVNASLERVKIISARPVGGPMECTTWDDIDQMLQRTNHYSKDRSGKMDWTLEDGYRLICSLHIF
jgi:hypothetical protein